MNDTRARRPRRRFCRAVSLSVALVLTAAFAAQAQTVAPMPMQQPDPAAGGADDPGAAKLPRAARGGIAGTARD